MKATNYHELSAMAQAAVDAALMNPEVAKTAVMYCGTLFVTCNAYSAAKIKTQLVQDLECGVQASKVGPEYAFDFVA
jgi:hypothetical protein